jgi:hypothetical protein
MNDVFSMSDSLLVQLGGMESTKVLGSPRQPLFFYSFNFIHQQYDHYPCRVLRVEGSKYLHSVNGELQLQQAQGRRLPADSIAFSSTPANRSYKFYRELRNAA